MHDQLNLLNTNPITTPDASAPSIPQPPEHSHDGPQHQEDTTSGVKYYPIDEKTARRANDANSMRDYKPGRATSEYRSEVDRKSTRLNSSHWS